MISAKEFVEMGYGEDECACYMAKLLDGMKETATNLRFGSCDTIHLGDSCAGEILKYTDKLLGHYREFADALAFIREDEPLDNFSIHRLELPRNVQTMLKRALCNKRITIKNFSLYSNQYDDGDLDGDGIVLSINVLENCEVAYFQWMDNRIRSPRNWHLLFDSIVSCSALVKVNIENSFGLSPSYDTDNSASYKALCSIIGCGRFKSVSFGMMNMQTKGDNTLFELLKADKTLEILDLASSYSLQSANTVTDEDAYQFREVLSVNTHLKYLAVLLTKGMTADGFNTLKDIIYQPGRTYTSSRLSRRNLNHAATSNHTCKMDFLDKSIKNGPLYNNGRSAEVNRGYKIYSVLLRDHAAMCNLNIDLDLVPDAMVAMHKHAAAYQNVLGRPRKDCDLFSLIYGFVMRIIPHLCDL